MRLRMKLRTVAMIRRRLRIAAMVRFRLKTVVVAANVKPVVHEAMVVSHVD